MAIGPNRRSRPDHEISVMMSDIKLEVVSSAKVLEIYISSNLSDIQLTVGHQCKKIDSALFLISNAAKHINSHTMRLLCNAFILPHLYFCCEVWGPLCNTSQISSLNKRIKKCQSLCAGTNLKWPSFFNIHVDKLRTCLFSFKCRNNLCPSYLCNKLLINESAIRTRTMARQDCFIPRVSPNFGKASFSYFASVNYNSLPYDLKALPSFNSFKYVTTNYFNDM